MNRSRLLSLANAARIEAGKQVQALFTRASSKSTSSLPEGYMGTWPYLGPANPHLELAWKTAEALIRQIREETEAHGAEFWLASLDMTVQTSPDLAARAALKRRLGVDSLFISDRFLDDFATRENIHHVILAPEIARYTEVNRISVHGFPGGPSNTGHWNEAGHNIASVILARELCAKSPALIQRKLRQ